MNIIPISKNKRIMFTEAHECSFGYKILQNAILNAIINEDLKTLDSLH